ncbi:MAG TPA: hypothetical protein VMW02_01350, partial [Thermoplasmata archaeon]|nr:hypothetical protein [Thermoplasmata archaeon]
MSLKVVQSKMLATAVVMVMCFASLLVLCQNASAIAIPVEQDVVFGDLGVPRTSAAVFMYGDETIYVIGGYTNGPSDSSNQVDTVLIYDVDTVTTSMGTKMPTGMSDSAYAKGMDGKFYIFGGYNNTLGIRTNMTQIYDPDADSWSVGKNVSTILYATSAVTGTDGRIYLFGGWGMMNVTLIYDTVSDSWIYGADLPTPRFGVRAVAVNDTAIFVIGGANAATAASTVEVYDPVADSWSTADSLNLNRNYAGAVLARNGYIYAISGVNGWF